MRVASFYTLSCLFFCFFVSRAPWTASQCPGLHLDGFVFFAAARGFADSLSLSVSRSVPLSLSLSFSLSLWFVSVRLAEFQSKEDEVFVPWLQVVVLLVFCCRVSGLLSCSLVFRSLSLSASFVLSSLFFRVSLRKNSTWHRFQQLGLHLSLLTLLGGCVPCTEAPEPPNVPWLFCVPVFRLLCRGCGGLC